MAVIEVQKIPVKEYKITNRELYATVCLHYSQYTLKDVQDMPARDITLLIKVAQKDEAKKMYNLAQISAAANSSDGKAMNRILERFREIAQ